MLQLLNEITTEDKSNVLVLVEMFVYGRSKKVSPRSWCNAGHPLGSHGRNNWPGSRWAETTHVQRALHLRHRGTAFGDHLDPARRQAASEVSSHPAAAGLGFSPLRCWPCCFADHQDGAPHSGTLRTCTQVSVRRRTLAGIASFLPWGFAPCPAYVVSDGLDRTGNRFTTSTWSILEYTQC